MKPDTYMTAAEIRTAFLKFFESKGHPIVASSPVIPQDDPTLLFTNAGMNQFKDNFLGLDKSLKRATTAQKCIRAGGKHNDLDNVGYTARHHTFFEMLGNFSFGDYFKREAIAWAWELLTQVYKLPAERLWVTVYIEDDEAYDIWNKEIGVPAERIVRIGDNKGARYMSDNFWMMGDTGPCGPCSEIFFDRGPKIQGGPPGSPDEDGDRYMEIWNLVFTQFNRDTAGNMNRLPKPNIDTGMGLERLASVLQEVDTNYDIDLFQNLMRAAKEAVEAAGAENVDPQSPSLKVIADHIRSCGFAVADGVKPGNEGRAYVIRRICRRAIRHGYKLGARGLFFYKLIEPLAREMGDIYPEIKNPKIAEVIRAEEERFLQTLSNGMQILDEAMAECKDGVLPGDIAFKLHDTYGFPVDLTGDVCRERGLTVDTEGFEACMLEQKNKARAAGKFKIAADVLFTGDNNEFVGYDTLETPEAKVLALYKDGIQVESAQAGDDVLVILDKTPFYAEMGGQVGDTGVLENGTTLLQVRDCLKLKASVFSHVAHVCEGEIKTGDTFKAVVDAKRREAIMRNHSVTHIMHKALREVLGEHVAQKGSLVNDAVTRFDFHHDKPMTADEIRQVEDIVNAEILANTPVQCRVMSLEDARNSGATMLFGEKYGDTVRVVNANNKSIELCGGTHADNTAKLGLFKIVSESSVAAGIRRIAAVTGFGVLKHIENDERIMQSAAAAMKLGNVAELDKRAATLAVEVKAKDRELAELRSEISALKAGSLMDSARQVGGVRLITAEVEVSNPGELRSMCDTARDNGADIVAVFAGVNKEKGTLNFACACGADAIKLGAHAGNIVRETAKIAGGSGGGKPDSAMAGAKDASKADEALAAVDSIVSAMLK